MGEWAVPIYAALIAALATVIGALLSAMKERKDSRARILQDIEILKAIPSGTGFDTAILKVHIQQSIDRLSVEKAVSRHRMWMIASDVSAIFFVGVLTYALSVEYPGTLSAKVPLWLSITTAIAIGASVFLHVFILTSLADRTGERELKIKIQMRDNARAKHQAAKGAESGESSTAKSDD